MFKAPSTPAAFERGFLEVLGLAAEHYGHDLRTFLRRVEIIVHGTTVATNALVEGVNRRWNGTPDRRVIGPPRPDGCSSVERAVLSPLGGARAGSERAPSTLASGRRGRGLWTPVG